MEPRRLWISRDPREWLSKGETESEIPCCKLGLGIGEF